jgi:hypothetical protein
MADTESMELPDGTFTDDHAVWIAAWRTFWTPIEVQLGVKVYGWTPGSSVAVVNSVQDDWRGSTVQLPIWFARRLSEVLK